MEQREKETWGEGLMDGQGREIEPGDHVAVLFRETGEQAEVTELIRDRCEKKRWYLLYIARFPEKNPAIFRDDALGAKREGTCILSCDDPQFHRTFATTESARTFIRKSRRSGHRRLFIALYYQGSPAASSRTGRARVS